MKTCNTCKTSKESFEFTKRTKNKDKLSNRCRECEKEFNLSFKNCFDDKECSTCKVIKPIIEFNKNSSKPFGINHQCKLCIKKYKDENKIRFAKDGKEWREKNKEYKKQHAKEYHINKPEIAKNRNLIKDYNITLEQYNLMLVKQNYCCDICNIHQMNLKKALSVDHNHTTGKVRALLCNNCNTALGHLKENIDLFEKAKQYIIKHNYEVLKLVTE